MNYEAQFAPFLRVAQDAAIPLFERAANGEQVALNMDSSGRISLGFYSESSGYQESIAAPNYCEGRPGQILGIESKELQGLAEKIQLLENGSPIN